MLQQTTKRQAGTNRMGAANRNDRSRMFFALVLLLVALAVVVVNDRDFWFADTNTTAADDVSPEWVPSPSKVAATHAAPAPTAAKHVAAPKSSAKPAIAGQPVLAISRNVIPPLEVEVVAGASNSTVRLGSNPEKVEMPRSSRLAAADSTVAEPGPARVAAERVQLVKAQVPAYPSLSRQMKVEGSVLLQAFIAADGTIQDLRVLSGPAILASAAREAAQHWQFKPYLQNGKPVETQAKIAVNFTIKVLENGVRDQMDTVVALSRGGE
ncbi:MAG TPA: energy transducer TonB [Terriglobales bacterium]|nr:energy transducer TonB [Terriglobales bacterium]